jgi:RNA polymerase sigma factor (sigma-70 family)
MSQHEGCLAQLLRRVREGDAAAAEELVEGYGPHVLRIVRRTLNPRLRSKFDSQDFVQSVWASFFADFRHLVDNIQLQDIAAYLGAIARHKTIDEGRRRLQTQKCLVNREVPWDGCSEESLAEIPDRVAGPTDAAVARETWGHLTNGRSDRSVQVFELRRHGASHVEIAQRLGVNERTVRRILDRAQRRLKQDTEAKHTAAKDTAATHTEAKHTETKHTETKHTAAKDAAANEAAAKHTKAK